MTPIRLVWVDDEQDFAEDLIRRLEDLGYEVARVGSGEEVLRLLDKDRSIDVLLLEVKAPGLGGLETLRRIKTLRLLMETIILSADTSVATAVEAMRLGAWDYLLKPCDVARLTAAIAAAARRKRERERKILEVHMRPYTTGSEREELIASILAG